MTPDRRKLFLFIAIVAAAAGSYMEAMRHQRLKEQRANPASSAAPAPMNAPNNPAH
jgi:hypothetical protein